MQGQYFRSYVMCETGCYTYIIQVLRVLTSYIDPKYDTQTGYQTILMRKILGQQWGFSGF